VKKNCEYCGTEFNANTSGKYCSLECREQEYRIRKQIKYQTDPKFKKKHTERNIEYRPKRNKYMRETGYMKKYMKQWREKNYEHWISYKRNYLHKNKGKNAEQCQKYRQTEKGKIAAKKHKAKRRGLGTLSIFGNQLIFPEETKPEFAHINRKIGAYLPKITHNLVPGINKKEHTENTIRWIEKIYQINLNKLFNL